jgi:hypothetical protein
VRLLAIAEAVFAGVYLWRRRPHVRQIAPVSRAWLAEQDRLARRDTAVGVSIKWPINKIVNEAALFNRARTKRRA